MEEHIDRLLTQGDRTNFTGTIIIGDEMKYRILKGVNYTPSRGGQERRAEPGDVVEDLPGRIIPTWRDEGVIEPVGSTGRVPKKRPVSKKGDD